MKKLITLLLIVPTMAGFSQTDTVNVSDFTFPGLKWNEYSAYDVTNSVHPIVGANKTWDYSNFTHDSLTVNKIVAMADAPNPNYPEANYAQNTDDTIWSYGAVTDEGIIALADYEDEDDGMVYFKISMFPEKVYLGSKDSVAYISSNSLITIAKTFEGVGNGTLITPIGTFTNTVLVLSTQYSCYEDNGATVCDKDEEIYTWFEKSSFGAVCDISIDPGDDTYELYWYEDITPATGVTTLTKQSKLVTISDNSILINSQSFDKIEVIDLKGTKCLTDNTGRTQLSIKDLKKGVYIYQISNNSTVIEHGKFIKY